MHKGSILFTGESGQRYTFMVWPMDTRFKSVGGVYFITQRIIDKHRHLRPHHSAIFIGQTDNLAQSFNVDVMPERYLEFGANSICVHLHDDAIHRAAIERDLLSVYRTDCNP